MGFIASGPDVSPWAGVHQSKAPQHPEAFEPIDPLFLYFPNSLCNLASFSKISLAAFSR